MNTKKYRVIAFIGLALLLNSCDAVKRVKANEHLLTENKVVVDGKKNNEERINNIPLQKPNTTIPFIGVPFKLHVYNLARPNIDSILQAKILDDEDKVNRKIKLLSKKQFNRELQARKNFNAWLKRNGEAPTILDLDKTEKSKLRLKAYYQKRGWLDSEVDYSIVKDSNKRAQVSYNITKNKPYVLDTLKTFIKTPIVDSIFQNSKSASLLKKGQQYDEDIYTAERVRINNFMRNSGIYHFGQEYVSFTLDTIGLDKNKFNAELAIDNRFIREDDSSRTEPFKVYKIKEVNIFTDYTYENQINKQLTDTTRYKGYNLYSFDELKFKPRALTDAVFISDSLVYRDIDRSRTSRYLNQLQMFRYPSIDYIENEADTTLTANIYLSPRKKYSWNNEINISQSNIQTVGFSFSTGLRIRNAFKGAEILDISALGSIGASRDAGDDDDTFFDINEFGGNISLTLPRFFLPFNTDKIIPKYMSPTTKINLSATSQQNIGLDKQTLSGFFSYNWFPSETVTNNLELFNVQFVKNLNTSNYFGVYTNSFDRLDNIARNIGYINDDETLTDPDPSIRFSPADTFIDDVLNDNTPPISEEDFITVQNIKQRQDRLTEDNLILSTSFDYKKDRRKSLSDNDFSIFKFHAEFAGNLLSLISKTTNAERNDDGRFNVLGVTFSQYFKAEVDYVKYFGLGRNSVLAMRSYFGFAIPYGNSNSIPFAESYFAGGPNDNRAWSAYNLGPGSSDNTNEFSEANLKLHFSIEQRFNLFGSFDGALFIDAGNIWNALDDVTDANSTFDSFSSLRDIAIGSGFGIRYDFDFFVIRFDTGFKTYNPALETQNRWFSEYNFKNAAYNIGINYPF